MKRCPWAENSFSEMEQYHDQEWCKPSHDEKYFFEMLTLELSQAGLSWSTIIKRREGYRHAFADFDYEQVAQFDQAKIELLLQDKNIIRNKLKVNATVNNAKMIVGPTKRNPRFFKSLLMRSESWSEDGISFSSVS